MTRKRSPGAGEKAQPPPPFETVPLRARRDGWTPARQTDFIRALAECGCVRDACRRVGMSVESAYALARRPEAQSFRVAWDLALDNAVRRMADEAFSRAVHGVAVPHYYKGELVGEHRRYNERLVQFLLRYRDPYRYGRHLDRAAPDDHPEGAALALGDAIDWMARDALREQAGLPRLTLLNPTASVDEEAAPVWAGQEDPDDTPWPEEADDDPDWPEDEEREPAAHADGDMPPNVASTSSTSGDLPIGHEPL